MPPALPVQWYEPLLSYENPKVKIDFELNVKYDPAYEFEVRYKLHDWQIADRSRLLAAAFNALRMNEIDYRLDQISDHLAEYKKFAATEKQSLDLFEIVMSCTVKALKGDIDLTKIREYIKDHKDSSMGRPTRHGRGLKWAFARSVSASEWRNIKSILDEIISAIHKNPGLYNDIVFWFGGRARSPGVGSFKDHYTGSIERTRLVMFKLVLSIWNMFIKDKVAWYKDIFDQVKTYLKIDHLDIKIPFIDGGDVYGAACDWFSEKKEFRAFDGKSWESGVPILLGPAFNAFMVAWKHPTTKETFLMLPSGIAMTSVLNTIANMVFLSRATSGCYIILGDDLNTFDARGLPKAWFMEFQKTDTTNKYILGLSFRIDPYLPVIIGLKITMDRGSEAIPVPVQSGAVVPTKKEYSKLLKGRHVIYKKRAPEERALYYGMLFGFFGKQILMDSMKGLKPEEYMSPGEMFERQLDKWKSLGTDVFAWAEEQGLKMVIAV
jgi:hypothetical protein